MSVEELVNELRRTVKFSTLAALLGPTGIVNIANAELDARMNELKHPPAQARWVELAVEPVRVVSKPTDTTLSIEEVYQSAAPGVQGYISAMRGEIPSPRKLEVQRMHGAQWMSFDYSEWNDHYRHELAKVWGCSHRDYAFPFFGDLAKIRNDFIHNSGIAKRATGNCQILDWFNTDEQMFLTPAMYVDVIQKWPWEQLLTQPEPVDQGRSPYTGRAPLGLIDKTNRAAVVSGVKPDTVIEEALQLWLDSDLSSQSRFDILP